MLTWGRVAPTVLRLARTGRYDVVVGDETYEVAVAFALWRRLRSVPRLHEHFAACDAAVVQAGGTTTLELTALRRPFIYVPLARHDRRGS